MTSLWGYVRATLIFGIIHLSLWVLSKFDVYEKIHYYWNLIMAIVFVGIGVFALIYPIFGDVRGGLTTLTFFFGIIMILGGRAIFKKVKEGEIPLYSRK